MEAKININMRIDVSKNDIYKTFRERVYELKEVEIQQVIPILNFSKVTLLLENCDGDTQPMRDKLMNIYLDKIVDGGAIKHLFSINQSYTDDDIINLINSLRKKSPEELFDSEYVKKLIKNFDFCVLLESDDIFCVKFSISVDKNQEPQKPIHVTSHIIAVYGIMVMLESAFWNEFKNFQKSKNND
jgi:hypothetical protein